MKKLLLIMSLFHLLGGAAQAQSSAIKKAGHTDLSEAQHPFPLKKSDEDWKKKLSPEQFYILRQKGTERPFSGEFEDHHETGIYTCAACGHELFRSESKFDAGCGWPSFYSAIDSKRIVTQTDRTHGMVRTEIMCANCGGHLGHVFDDGPRPTSLRYCVNSVSLDFKKVNVSGKNQAAK